MHKGNDEPLYNSLVRARDEQIEELKKIIKILVGNQDNDVIISWEDLYASDGEVHRTQSIDGSLRLKIELATKSLV